MTNKFHTMTSIRRGVVRPTLLFSATYLLLSAKDCGRLLSKNISENLGVLKLEDTSLKNQTTNSTPVPSALPSNDQGGTAPKSHKANNLNQPNQSSEPNQPNAPNAPNPLNPLNEPHKPNKPNEPGGPVSGVESIAGRGTVLNLGNYSCGLFIASETGEAFIVELPAQGGWVSLLQEDSDSRSLQFRYDAVSNPCILKVGLAFVDLLCQRFGHSDLSWRDVAFCYKPSMDSKNIFTEEGVTPSTEFTKMLHKIKTDGDRSVQPIIPDPTVVSSVQSVMPGGAASLSEILPANLEQNKDNAQPFSRDLQEPHKERKDSDNTDVVDNTDHNAGELKQAGKLVVSSVARQGACGSGQYVSSTSVPPPPPEIVQGNREDIDLRDALLNAIRAGKKLKPVEIDNQNNRDVLAPRDESLRKIREGVKLKKTISTLSESEVMDILNGDINQSEHKRVMTDVFHFPKCYSFEIKGTALARFLSEPEGTYVEDKVSVLTWFFSQQSMDLEYKYENAVLRFAVDEVIHTAPNVYPEHVVSTANCLKRKMNIREVSDSDSNDNEDEFDDEWSN